MLFDDFPRGWCSFFFAGQEVIWPRVGQTIFLSGPLGTPTGPRGTPEVRISTTKATQLRWQMMLPATQNILYFPDQQMDIKDISHNFSTAPVQEKCAILGLGYKSCVSPFQIKIWSEVAWRDGRFFALLLRRKMKLLKMWFFRWNHFLKYWN